MGWLEGLLTGYADRSHTIEKDKMAEAIRSQEMEGKVYEHLLNSTDTNLKHYAAAGMLDMANPLRKTKGLRGWLGEVERSPMLPIIRKYMNTPQQVEETTTVPGLNSTQTTGYTSLPPSGQPSRVSAALSEESPTETGTPPMTAPVPAPPPPPPGGARGDPSVAPGLQIMTDPPIQGPPLPPGQLNPDPGLTAKPPLGYQNPDPGLTRRDFSEANVVSPITPSQFGDQNVYEPGKAFQSGTTSPPPLPTPPPLPPESMSATRQVPGTPWERTETVSRLPEGFPTTGDTYATNEAGKVRGEISGLQEAFRQQGDPNWQKSGLDAYLAQHIRAGGGAGSTRAVQTREMIAFKMFGKPGDDPTQTMRKLTPKQMGAVLEEDNVNAAERALTRAKAMADAPLMAQARSALIETLNTKWRSAEKPHRDMQRALQQMQVGVDRFAADPIGASQAVLITFQKILDPESVVREGEYARSATGLPILSRMQGLYDRYIGKWDPVQGRWVGGGAGVPIAELQGMLETAKQFLMGMESSNADERQRIEDRAVENEIDPGLIFGGGLRGVTPPPAPPGVQGAPQAAPNAVTPPAAVPGGPPAPPPVTAAPAAPGASERVPSTGFYQSPTTGKSYFNGKEI